MPRSKASWGYWAVVLAWWGIAVATALPGAAAESPMPLPIGEKPGGETPPEHSAGLKAPAEVLAMQQRLQAATEAYEALKRELAPHIAEAQARLRQATAALEKARPPGDTKGLEDELRLARAWLSLQENQLAVAAEAVRVAAGLLETAQRRAALPLDKARQEEELRTKQFTPYDAKVATAEAKVAAERAAVAAGRVEALQQELLALEREAAEADLVSTRAEQEANALAEKVHEPSDETARAALGRELTRARQRVGVLQKKAELAHKQVELTRGKSDLAQHEHDLLAAQGGLLEAKAQAIRAAVGVSLEDLKAEEEGVAAAQRAAEAERRQAQQEQAKAQREQQQAQAALEKAKAAREQAATAGLVKLAELHQQLAEKRAELAEKKAELAKAKIEVAESATQLAQNRLTLATKRLAIERKALTAAEILEHYELAKAEAARAFKAAQSSRANAELAEERARVAEEWANLLQERARLAEAMVQTSSDMAQLFSMHRATYQLWKREPSKISWGTLDALMTDLAVLRSTLIIGLSTLPAKIVGLLERLKHPWRYWEVLRTTLGMAATFALAVLGATWLRRSMQPLIARQEAWSQPSARRRLLRSGTRLLHATALELFPLVALLLLLRLIDADTPFLSVVAIALAGATGCVLLTTALQELFMPWNPSQRLIPCRNRIAVFLYAHVRRISLYTTLGMTILAILQAVAYREGFIELLRLGFDVGLLVLFILMVVNKEAILSLLPHAENRLEKILYVTVTQVYPLLVLLLICIIALSTLGYVNLAKFLAAASALTAVTLAAAHLACKGMDRCLRWWFLTRRRLETELASGAETRETLYAVLMRVLSYLVYIIAVVVIAGIWGVDLSGVYATLTSERAWDYYERLAVALLIMVVSSLFLRSAYYVIDVIFNLSAEEVRAWRRRIALGDKGRTIAPLLKSLLKYGTIFVAAVLVLRAMGVDPTPIIAGAGVIGVAVGFGAQTLVKDVIAGFFLLFEGVIAVGDVITFGGSAGVVEEVGLRVTKYRTFAGELWVIPNGEIRAFGNYNRQWTRAIVSVGVAYEQDVGKAMRIMEEVGKQWAEERRDIVLEEPEVQGIIAFDASSVSLRLVVKVRPLQHWAAERELRRQLKEAFDREGIEIPFPRQVVYTRPEANGAEDQGRDLSLISQRIQKLEQAPERAGGGLPPSA